LVLGSVALFSVVTFASPPQQAQEPPLPAATPAAQANEPTFQLRVQKNVVVVRVVVRDSKGRAVGGLRKEDFRISDNGKPQEIGSFSVETSEAAAVPAQPSAAATAAKAGQEAAAAPSAPVSYLAFYFDDLYSAQDSLYRSGQAAEKFIAGLPPAERVAVFTSSGTQTLDFTDDRQKIHEVLSKLRVNSRASPEGRCPEINDYLAYRIIDVDDRDPAWGIITDETVNVCHMPPEMADPNHLRPMVTQAYSAYRMQSRVVLKNLESVIERVARMPGERQVILVSDGFMSLDANNGVESVVDRALRARVTISALDGKGLATNMVEMDASRSYMPDAGLSSLMQTYSTAREVAATGTLAEVAQGTGGQFVGETNDLLGGMRKVLLPPEVMYVLTFSPENLKQDGAFHTLKVTLANGRGLSIQARRGYFAPKGQAALEELAKNEIREAVYSQDAIQDLPLTFETQVRKAEGQNEDIAVQAALDVRDLPFEKQGDLNLAKVVFAVGLFDRDGKYVTGSQQTYTLSLKDATRAEMERRGLALKTKVSAKAGAYTVRVVVRDSQGGNMAAASKAVEVPSETAPAAVQQIVPSAPVANGYQGGEMAASSKAVEVPPQTPAAPPDSQGGEMAALNKPTEVPPPPPATPPGATVQASPDKEMATQDVQPSYTFRVQRNMVVVRVIVRDANGRPVPKLRKEDFRLFDNGKEQGIDQFSEESRRVAPAAAPAAPGKPSEEKSSPGTPPASTPVAPQNFQALYFDDLQSEFSDLNRARDAAERYVATALTPADWVGVFTASGQGVLDFTSDREQLHEALLKLRPRPLFLVLRSFADVLLTTDWVLRGLEQVVRRTALLPGQRSIIMLSPGMLSTTTLYSLPSGTLPGRVYEIAERALGRGVVINVINLRGLYAIIPGGDASQGNAPTGPWAGLAGLLEVSASARADDTFYDFASITGGQVFHNDNDLEKGLRRVGTLADVYYVLALSPRNLKPDGHYHQLKVSLVNPGGLTVQARHGYFAPKASEDAAAKAKEEIEQAMYSQDELRDLPIEVHTQFYKLNETDVRLAVLTHLDMSSVRFHKEADRNRNDVTFVTVLFDLDGKYVAAKEKRVELRLRDSTLERLIKSGITLKTEFDVKPGTYMVRQIVRDSEASQLASLSRTVEIPY
jgi:VWFA-related protein